MGQILTLKALALLLTYPGEALSPEAAARLPGVLEEDGRLDAASRAGLDPLIRALAQDDPYDLQETYVSLFDRSRRLCLHLFEHVHGEGRARGQAMVDLAALYTAAGLAPVPGELPDFLPLFLEYAATRPLAEAQALLADVEHILAALEGRLAERGSDYAAVFTALRHLAGEARRPGAGESCNASAEPADDLATLDKEWEETAVTFGPGDAASCSVDRFRTQLRAAQRDVRHPAA